MAAERWFDAEELSRLKRMVGAKVVVEIIDLFLVNAPKRIAALRAGERDADFSEMALALHSLKSSAGMLGACELQELASGMEQHARAEERECVAARLDDLDGAFDRAKKKLSTAARALADEESRRS